MWVSTPERSRVQREYFRMAPDLQGWRQVAGQMKNTHIVMNLLVARGFAYTHLPISYLPSQVLTTALTDDDEYYDWKELWFEANMEDRHGIRQSRISRHGGRLGQAE